jgi:DNA polymerase III delta subunit
MNQIQQIINFEVKEDKAVITMNKNTASISRRELKQLIDLAIRVEYQMKQAEDAKSPLRLVSSC